MRVIRAIVLSTWFYSLLLWLYVVARVTLNRVNWFDRFIAWVPFFTFFSLGLISFALSFICLVVYLALWGFKSDGERNTPDLKTI